VETRRREILALGAILALAALVRGVGLDFGTPLLHCRPDERTVMSVAMRFGTGDLNPHFFHYGTLWPYTLAAAYGAYFALGWMVGWFASPRDLLELYDFAPTPLLLIPRALSVATGVAGVFFAARAARTLLGPTVGLVSAALLGLTYLHVRDSHFATVDVPMTAFLAASFLFLARALRSGARLDFVLAGVCAGLAASTKYVGVMMLVPAVWVWLCRVREEAARWWPDGRALGFAAALVLAFIAGTPFALLDAQPFLRDVLAESHHLRNGHYVDLPRGFIQHLRVSLLYGMGAPLLAASLAGAALLAIRRPREGVLLLAFPLVYFALLAPSRTVFVRYALPLLPFLCVAAAFALVELGRTLAPRSATVAIALLCVVTLAPSARRIVQLDALLLETDNRWIVRSWIEQNLPHGSSIHQAVPGSFMQGPQWARIDLAPTPQLLERDLAKLVVARSERRIRALIERLRTTGATGFEEIEFEAASARFVSLVGEPSPPPRYVLIARHPLRRLRAPSRALREILTRDYTLVRRFEAMSLAGEPRVYDHQDAFFLPFASFEGVERPGPSYELYERTDREGPWVRP
jgi:hypothetical protein